METKSSQFGSAFAWLLAKGVSSDRLATLFGTTPANIRVIAFRARHNAAAADSTEAVLGDRPVPDVARVRGLRAVPDDVVRTPARARNLDSLRNAIEETVARCAKTYEFLNGARELRQLLPRIGYAGDSRRIGLRALIHERIAWFLVHSGWSVSAAAEARAARDLWRVAYHESPTPDYGRHFVQAALIGSHAWLLAHRPRDAWAVLDIAQNAAESISAPLGSDHSRQRGVVLLQLREDRQAQRQFQKSAELMEKLNEASVPAQVAMTGVRHIGLLNLNCDQSRDVLDSTMSSFGVGSLEASMSLHWAAAVAISTDSVSVVADAVDLLSRHPAPSLHFGHQATIRTLLSITPELGLDARLRRAWVRWALYENAFRGN